MATVHPSDLVALNNAILALRDVRADRYGTGNGLTDAKIAAITSPGTVTKLIAAMDATTGYAAGDQPSAQTLSSAAIAIAAAPRYLMPIPTITSNTGSTSGGSLAAGAYKIKVTAFDRNGYETQVSAEGTGTVASGTTGSIPVVIPATRGAVKFRVYYSNVDGAANSEDRYLESGATAGISSSAVTVTITTVTVSGAVVSGTPPASTVVSQAAYGILADIDVETARAAGTYASLLGTLTTQHPDGTAAGTGPNYMKSVPFDAAA